MRRGRRRGRGADEINLTPLLDVLFTILFIVMLAGTQTERIMQEDAEEAFQWHDAGKQPHEESPGAG